jgi:hypothetical protein
VTSDSDAATVPVEDSNASQGMPGPPCICVTRLMLFPVSLSFDDLINMVSPLCPLQIDLTDVAVTDAVAVASGSTGVWLYSQTMFVNVWSRIDIVQQW